MKRNLNTMAAVLLLGLGISAHAAVTGQWDFNSSNLTATVGTALTYLGSPATTFTNITIAGNSATVMGYPGCSSSEGYIMTHGMAPNGGYYPDGITLATNVNQYTLIMDIMFPSSPTASWHTLLQAYTNNDFDATFFVKSSASYGIGNYGVYAGSLLPLDSWHRVVCVMDLSTNATASGTNWWKYIDGVLVGTQAGIGDPDNDRFSLLPTALLFTDNDGDTGVGYVNSIQIRDELLTPSQVSNLGGPTATGIPLTIPTGPLAVSVTPATRTDVVGMSVSKPFTANATFGTDPYSYQWYFNGVAMSGQTSALLSIANPQTTNSGNYTVVATDASLNTATSSVAALTITAATPTVISGQWDFNAGNLAASYGSPLAYFDINVQGDTSFGTTTSLGITDIAGQPANVMYWNPVSVGRGYYLTNGIAPNGGGTNVNQYTLIYDIYLPFDHWTSLWQTDITNSTDDGDAFINSSGQLGISGSYTGGTNTALVTSGEWHRVVLAFDETIPELAKYIDGTNTITSSSSLHLAQTVGDVDGRWSAGPVNLLLGDNGDDVGPIYVSSVQIRSGRMTDAAVLAMGAPTAGKIPGLIKATPSGGNVVIDWTGSVLESATSVTGPWTVVPGATHPHTVVAPTGTLFFKPATQ
jgi:hypothetical protein